MSNSEHKTFHSTIVTHTRLDTSTYNLLNQISKVTKLSKSTLLRAAVSQWLKNAPSDLPIELKVAIAHQLMREQIGTIKQLRWIYYAAKDAYLKIQYSEKHTGEKASFPPHVRKALRQLERNIIAQKQQLDTWLQTSMRSNVANEQNVYTDTEMP